jgi:hypothetical protein
MLQLNLLPSCPLPLTGALGVSAVNGAGASKNAEIKRRGIVRMGV